MPSASSLNKNNAAVKRIMQEARELANDPCTDYSAAPLEDDIFEWHCTLRGPAGTEFEGGLYHFRILLPAEYPFRPPSIMILTPNGRFELNTKICISFTSYHEEMWQPAWGVRTAILGLQGFFPLKGQAAVGIGSIEYPPGERKRLALLSRDWVCPHCQESNLDLLPDPVERSTNAGSVEPPPSVVTERSAPAEPQVSRPTVDLDAALSISEPSSHVPSSIRSESKPAVDLLISPSAGTITETQPRPASIGNRAPISQVMGQAIPSSRRSGLRPPLALDTAICILLVLACAMICRRMV